MVGCYTEPGGEEGQEDLEDADTDLDDAEADVDDADADFEDAEDSEAGESDDDEPEDEEEADDDEDKELDEFLIREYTEKVPTPKNTDEAGNKKSPIISGKNDMGGTAKNIVQGGTADAGRKVPAPKPLNIPPQKGAAAKAFKSKAPAPVKKDESDNKKSVIESKKPKARK